jgi:hypothetical protein
MSTTIVLPLSTNEVDKPLSKGNNLIYSYMLESTNIVKVFGTLFSSFFVSDKYLKLTEKDDGPLIQLLKSTANEVFAKPTSTLAPPLFDLLHNAYWRVFGYTIKGEEMFPKGDANNNSEFHSTLTTFLFNVFQLIFDKGITSEKVGSPSATAEYANKLQRQLLGRTYNTIEHIADDSAGKLGSLLALLEMDDLMVERLNIRSENPSRRLIELGEMISVPVAKETSDLFLLAGRMNILLIEIQKRAWDPTTAAELASDVNEPFFKAIESSLAAVTGDSPLVKALQARKR